MSTQQDSLFTLHQGDARHIDRYLSKVSSAAKPLITATITSPPYGNLVNYGHPDQIGWGQPYEEFLSDCRRVFRALHKHTTDDGSLWLVADSLRPPPETNGHVRRLQPLPFQLAAEAEAVGWNLRDVIVWAKDKTRPWSGRGRLRNAFEYVMLLVKGVDFKYNVDRIRDQMELEKWWVKWPERYNPKGKVPTNVWHFSIPTQGSWNEPVVAHACPLPPDLVERLILLSTDPDDVVFDPFGGTGTVVAEAERLERRGLGLEINEEYVSAFSDLMRPALLARRSEVQVMGATQLEETIINLRALKYPKALFKQLRARKSLPEATMAIVLMKSRRRPPADPHVVVEPKVAFVVQGGEAARAKFLAAVNEEASRAPSSKMGVRATFYVLGPEEVAEFVPRKTLHAYPLGKTWWAEDKRVRVQDLADYEGVVDPRNDTPPIFADVRVQEEPRALTAGLG